MFVKPLFAFPPENKRRLKKMATLNQVVLKAGKQGEAAVQKPKDGSNQGKKRSVPTFNAARICMEPSEALTRKSVRLLHDYVRTNSLSRISPQFLIVPNRFRTQPAVHFPAVSAEKPGKNIASQSQI